MTAVKTRHRRSVPHCATALTTVNSAGVSEGHGVRGEGPTWRRASEQALLQVIDPGPDDKSLDGAIPALWAERLRDALAGRSPDARRVAEKSAVPPGVWPHAAVRGAADGDRERVARSV